MSLEISGQYGVGEIVVNSSRIQSPSRIDGIQKIDDKVVLQIGKSLDKYDDSDFDLPDPGRNIVAINSSGDVVWVVSDAPPESDTVESNYYTYVFLLKGRLYARDADNRIYEINPTNGEVEQSFECGILPIKDELVSVDGWVNKVIEFDDNVFLRTGEAQKHKLYGFDAEGNELWKSEGRRGMIYKDGDMLLEKRQRGPRTKEMYRLDPDTGERLAEIEAESTYWGWKYVRDISDVD